jgi:uncharacterized protein YdhG (YjbR/CyaY superfamily)
MVKSTASTVEAYLAALPEERRAVVSAVREVILRHLPPGYQETMNWGMISYEIPLAIYPSTYNRQPLSYLALAAQKHYYALYLSGVYGDPEQEAQLQRAFAEAGKNLDMGKSCLRFRTLDDVPWEVIGELVAGTPPAAYIARYESARQRS